MPAFVGAAVSSDVGGGLARAQEAGCGMSTNGWWTPIDAYCERTSTDLWAEPANAVSNAAFLIAAGAALALWRRAGAKDWPALLLIGIAALVGIGSFLFHTFANRWSNLADVLPITAFIYAYFLLAMRRYFGQGLWTALALTAGFALFSTAFVRLWILFLPTGGGDVTNGSFPYFPAAIALLAVGALQCASTDARQAAAGRALLLGTSIFVVSLTFRSIDHAICDRWPLGTHLVWHTLNGLLLFVLIRAAIVFSRRDQADRFAHSALAKQHRL
jgi:Ceramidase